MFGVIGANGICVLNLVEEECKEGRVRLRHPKEMVEKDVEVIQWKCKHVACSHVKFAKIVLVMPPFAQHGRNFAPTVLLCKAAAENHAICAESHFDNNKTDQNKNTMNRERIPNNILQNYTSYVHGNAAIEFSISYKLIPYLSLLLDFKIIVSRCNWITHFSLNFGNKNNLLQ